MKPDREVGKIKKRKERGRVEEDIRVRDDEE